MHLSLLVERIVPTKVIRVCINDKPGFNDNCRLAFDIKQGAHLRCTRDHSRVNWDEFFHYQRRANAVFADAVRQFIVRSRDVLMNAQCPLKVVVYPEVGCVRLRFGFVFSSSYWGWWWSGLVCAGGGLVSSYWGGWWSGLRVGWEGRNAVGPF